MGGEGGSLYRYRVLVCRTDHNKSGTVETPAAFAHSNHALVLLSLERGHALTSLLLKEDGRAWWVVEPVAVPRSGSVVLE